MQRCRIESLGVSMPRIGLSRWGSVRHAERAGRRCLEGSHYHPADVGVLINAGIHRDNHICEPSNAAFIQHRLGINIEFQGRRTLSFDLLNSACGMLTGIHVISALMQTSELQVGMVVASEANTDRWPDPSFSYPASGAALLLDRSPLSEVGIGAMAFHTHDEYADLFSSTVDLKEKRGRLSIRQHPKMEQVFLEHSGALVDELLEREGIGRDDVDRVVPAQLSGEFLARLPKVIGFPSRKVTNLNPKLADTHSTSVFLALHQTQSTAPLTRGQTALLLAFGSGITIGGAIYHY